MILPAKTGIAGAVVGISVILLLVCLQVQSFWPLIIFWPTSIIGFGYNGGEPITEFIIATLEFGGNALIYGVMGWVIGLILMRVTHKGAK